MAARGSARPLDGHLHTQLRYLNGKSLIQPTEAGRYTTTYDGVVYVEDTGPGEFLSLPPLLEAPRVPSEESTPANAPASPHFSRQTSRGGPLRPPREALAGLGCVIEWDGVCISRMGGHGGPPLQIKSVQRRSSERW